MTSRTGHSGKGRSGAGSMPALRLGRVRITLPVAVVLLALVGSVAFIVWVVLRVEDEQIPLLTVGFAAAGTSFAAIAVGALAGIWRAASRADSGRAFGLALVGGLAGISAIGSFTVMALLMLVWST